MDSRPKLVNKNTDQTYIFSTFSDLQEMYYLMQHGALGIRPYLADWYNRVFIPVFKEKGHVKKFKSKPDAKNPSDIIEEEYEGLYTSDLVEATSKYQGERTTVPRINFEYIEPLSFQSIIDKIPSTLDKRKHILRPVDEYSMLTSDFYDNNITTDPEMLKYNPTGVRIKLKDPAAFPSRDMLKKELRRFDKSQKQVGNIVQDGPTFFEKKSIHDSYVIVDENGNEITVDELIDRHYGRPEAFFEVVSNITSDKLGIEPETPKTPQNEPEQLKEVINGKKDKENNLLKKSEGSCTIYPTPFESGIQHPDPSQSLDNPGKQVGYIVQSTSTFFKNNYCAFDFEYSTKPDCFGRHHITWFSLMDSNSILYTKSLLDYSNHKDPEKELVKEAISQIMKYDVSYGWYSTGYRNKKTGRGRDSDLKVLNDAIFDYGLVDKRIIEVDNTYPYLAGIAGKTHIDLCLLYANHIVKDNIYADRYDERGLNVVSSALLKEGKFKELSGEDAPILSYEDQKEYVSQDTRLTLKLAEFEDFNALTIFQHISNIVGLSLEKTCHTNSSTWWEAGIEKNGGAELLAPYRQEKQEYAGGFVMIPEPKLYSYEANECGYVIDVASQYPTGIVNLNLSPETICCECCKDRPDALLPTRIMNEINIGLQDKGLEPRNIRYWICKQRKGFIAQLIKKYRGERLEYKRTGQTAKQLAMKILTNSLYGTFGQSSFKYSDYRLAEITTAFGRTVWKEMKELAESAPYGFIPIYGDTDSVFLTNVKSRIHLRHFLNDWNLKYNNIEIEIEDKKSFSKLLITGRKHYILEPFNTTDSKGNENPILIKGMEGKKSDRPKWINKIQYKLAYSLGDIEQIKRIFREEYNRMESGNVPNEELVMRKNLGTDPSEYKNNCIERRIGLEQGLTKGDTIKYYIGETGAAATDPMKISRKEYLDMLKDTFNKQLIPLGINFDRDIKTNGINLLSYEVKEQSKPKSN